MTNDITPEIIIKPELKNIRITVSRERIAFKFRSTEEQNKHLEKCKLIANKVRDLNNPVTLRGKYTPDSDYEIDKQRIIFLTSRRRQGKHCPEKFTINI